jgi:tetratricopeptide (TPR) repeat protein
MKLENFLKAKEFLKKSKEVIFLCYGSLSNEYTNTIVIYAQCLFKLKKYAEALENYEEALKCYIYNYGANHPYSLRIILDIFQVSCIM